MGLHRCTLALGILLSACTAAVREPRLMSPREMVLPDSPSGPLKVHMHSGDLVVLRRWVETDTALMGRGTRYGPTRDATLANGDFRLPFDSIALLEIEVQTGRRPTGVAGIAVWSVLYGALTIACVADPKACFGSCPTFYVAGDTGETLAAEGFSGSIARALEARDLDALFPARSTGGPFTITMRNEALETHAVRRLRLLAVPRPADGRVFAGPDHRLYATGAPTGPLGCEAAEGDCLAAVGRHDGVERASLADSTDLAATETLELSFPPARGQLGLVLAARQSLLPTYLFYQTMGFLGRRAGETLAALERGGPVEARRAMGLAERIGTLTLEAWRDGKWTSVGIHQEAGPLATQIRVLPFQHHGDGPVRLRLIAAKGAWRLDWAALVRLGEPVTPIELDPVSVTGDGLPGGVALALLLDPERHLVTYPGESYRITFDLPAAEREWELFLESEGYYYEWMRSEWLASEDPALAALALSDPARALQVLAPDFKRAESAMERRFWESRFRR